MPAVAAPFQTVDQRSPPDRTLHVWRRITPGKWKCVICGGETRYPSDHCDCDRHVKLSDEERALCPNR